MTGQKRIMVIFYPLSESQSLLDKQKAELTAPILKYLEAIINESVDSELKTLVKKEVDQVGIGEIYSKINVYVEQNEKRHDELNQEIESLEFSLQDQKILFLN